MNLKKRRCVVMSWDEMVGVVISVFVWAGTTLAVDGHVLGVLLFLLIVDAFTGFVKAVVLRKATSKELIHGLGKKLTIVFIPIAISAAAVMSGKDITTFMDFIYSMLAFGEAYSIVGNVIAINSRQEITEFDALSVIANGLRALLLAISGNKKEK